MLRYIIRRLLWAVVLLIAVIAITFGLFYLLPNVGPGRAPRRAATRRPRSSPRSRTASATDKPIYTQFWDYFKRLVFHLDLGFSYQKRRFGQEPDPRSAARDDSL